MDRPWPELRVASRRVEPDRRDMPMIDSDEAFAPCRSRALSGMLVLDL